MKLGGHRRGISLVSTVLLLAILVGLFLGPLQALYCVFMSGKSAGKYPMKGNRPVTVTLSPDMNPIRFHAAIRHADPRSIRKRRTKFDGTLSLDGNQIWTESFGVTSRDDKDNNSRTGISFNSASTTTVPIHAFDVATTGDYQFVAQKTESELAVKKMTLKVSRNVRLVHMPSAITGFTIMLLGIVVAVIRSIVSGKRRHATVEH